jgi:hypothetical protein
VLKDPLTLVVNLGSNSEHVIARPLKQGLVFTNKLLG